MEAALVDQGHHHGLDQVIPVMGVSDLSGPDLLCLVIESTLAHLGAERAGVRFLPGLKEDLSDPGLHYVVRHIQIPAEGPDRLQEQISQSQVNGNG